MKEKQSERGVKALTNACLVPIRLSAEKKQWARKGGSLALRARHQSLALRARYAKRLRRRMNKCCLSRTTCTESHPENLEYRPEFLGGIPNKFQTSRNFNFISSCLPENFPSLPIPGKIFRFPEEFCFSPETALLRVDTPPNLAKFVIPLNRAGDTFTNFVIIKL